MPVVDRVVGRDSSVRSVGGGWIWVGVLGPLQLAGIADCDAVGNTRAMTSMPNLTRYHRWLGWHAPAMRRTVIVGSIGVIVAVVLLWFVPWGMAVVTGWDAAALAFLITVWPIIIRADSGNVVQLARREDENRGSATVLLLGASVASLLGVGFALILAGDTTVHSRCCSLLLPC